MRTEYAQPLRFIFLAALINTRVIDSMTVKMTNQINGTKRKLCFQCLIYFLETRKLEFIFSKPGKEGVAGDKATQRKEIVYNKTCCYVNVFYIEYMFLCFSFLMATSYCETCQIGISSQKRRNKKTKLRCTCVASIITNQA